MTSARSQRRSGPPVRRSPSMARKVAYGLASFLTLQAAAVLAMGVVML